MKIVCGKADAILKLLESRFLNAEPEKAQVYEDDEEEADF